MIRCGTGVPGQKSWETTGFVQCLFSLVSCALCLVSPARKEPQATRNAGTVAIIRRLSSFSRASCPRAVVAISNSRLMNWTCINICSSRAHAEYETSIGISIVPHRTASQQQSSNPSLNSNDRNQSREHALCPFFPILAMPSPFERCPHHSNNFLTIRTMSPATKFFQALMMLLSYSLLTTLMSPVIAIFFTWQVVNLQ